MSYCISTPSSTAACRLLQGEPGSLGDAMGAMLGRAVIVAPGLYLLGGLRGKTLALASIGAAIAASLSGIYMEARTIRQIKEAHAANGGAKP